MKLAVSRCGSNASVERSLILAPSEAKEEVYKIVIAIFAIFGLLCPLFLCITVPSLIYSMNGLKILTSSDFNYCDASTQDVKIELDDINTIGLTRINRTRRSESEHMHDHGGGYGAALSSPAFQECPACCQPGLLGPPGDPGLPGLPGAGGSDGAGGRPGTTPNSTCLPERVFEPPPCLPCPQGPRGAPGHPGFPGDVGDYGITGRPGYEIAQGTPGPIGQPGYDGPPGVPGPYGDKGPTPESRLVPGVPGDAGDLGAWGIPGHAGSQGDDGYPGPAGEKGINGENGTPGGPGPYAPAGPAGEAGPTGTQGTCVCQDTEVIVQDAKGLIPAPDLSYNPKPPPPLPPLPVYSTPAPYQTPAPQPAYGQPAPQPVYGQPPPSPGYGASAPVAGGFQFSSFNAYKDLPDVGAPKTSKATVVKNPQQQIQSKTAQFTAKGEKRPNAAPKQSTQQKSKEQQQPQKQPSVLHQRQNPFFAPLAFSTDRQQNIDRQRFGASAAPRGVLDFKVAPSPSQAVSFGDGTKIKGYTVSGRRYGRPD